MEVSINGDTPRAGWFILDNPSIYTWMIWVMGTPCMKTFISMYMHMIPTSDVKVRLTNLFHMLI